MRAFLGHAFQHGLLPRAFHQLLGGDQAGEGLGRQFQRLFARVAVAFAGRQHAVDQADFLRGLGHEGLAQQQRFGRAVVAEHLRHQQAGRGFGAQAQVDEGHGKRGVVARVDQVAVQQQGGAHAHGRAANGRQQRLGQGGDAAQEAKNRRIHARGFIA